MQCERARELLSAYVDGEVDGEKRRAVAEHVERCPSCAVFAGDIRRIGGLLAEAGREPMPKSLALRIRRDIARAREAEGDEKVPARAVSAARWPSMRGSAVRQAATIVAACAVSALATWWLATSGEQLAQLEQDVLSAHVRSLLQESPVQIAETDAHVVKPWFAGRVDFAPEVKDLASEGFPLIGGRLDYVGSRRVGVLVYKRRQHTVDVFMWAGRDGGELAPRLTTLNGYNVLIWGKKGLTLWAISDLNAGELRELQGLL
jgi:anti-sigma factor RsiW